MKWIFGSALADALFLVVPGLAALSFAQSGLFASSAVYILFALVFADAGHVYTTLWRTWFHPTERRRSAYMWMIPVGVAAVFITWSAFKLPYLATFAIYAALLYNMKQMREITHWYEQLNQRASPKLYSYALMLIPLVAWTYKPGATGGFYSPHDFLLFPNAQIYTKLMWLNFGVMSLWIRHETWNFRGDWNRILSIGFSSLLYTGAFFYGQNITQVLLPLVLSHGITYLALTSLSLKRTRPKYFSAAFKSVGVVALTALIFGALHRVAQSSLHGPQGSWLEAGLVTLYMIPLFSHFLYDLMLWKETHWEARLVYGFTGKRADIATLETQSRPQDSADERAS